MLTGVKGVKYGLVVPKSEPKPLPRKTLAAFAEDDSDEEPQNVAKAIERQAQRKQTDSRVAKLQEAALAEDPSVFDYDSHFDTIQEQREGPKAAERQARKSRYIEGLLDKAKERQKEQDIVYERRLIKERQVEDHLFGDKEKFVTAAYKRKLEEDKKWLEEEALREKVEASQDVRKRGHMGDFYRNLLTNNVAFGTGKDKGPAASSGPDQPAEESKPGAGDKQWEELVNAREAYEARLGQQNAAAPKFDGPTATPQPGLRESAGDAAAAAPAAKAVTEEQSKEEPADSEPAQEEQLPTVSREDKAQAARERYLARKRKAPG